MDAIISNTGLQDAIVEGQAAAVDRLRSKDFAGTLLGFVDEILGAPRAPAPHVTYDFWHQFDAAQALEELRLYRPVDLQGAPGGAMIVNQWVPAAHRGDAIGDSARRVRDLLRQLGHSSDVYALSIDDELTGDVRPFSDPGARRGDLTIFHYALPSPMTDGVRVARRRAHPAISQRHAGRVLRAVRSGAVPPGRARPEELATLAGRVDLALGDSEYNRQELESLGFEPTGVFPIAVDTAA